jgi:hypothetical protein
LGVSDEPQDWDVVNADAERLEEFATFLQTQALQPTQIFDLVGLVFASANERLLGDACADVSVILEVIRADPGAAAVHYYYWAQLADVNEFPLGSWLRTKGEGS